MWKSFVYKDFDWSLSRQDDRPTLLEIKAKGSSRQPTCIFTKQVSHLLYLIYWISIILCYCWLALAVDLN